MLAGHKQVGLSISSFLSKQMFCIGNNEHGAKIDDYQMKKGTPEINKQAL
jgi:hypothetical protein